MSATTVQNKLIDIFQKAVTFNTEFATALTGTSSSSGTAVTGVNTLFLSEIEKNDYIGNPTKGYRRVISITDATHLTVDSAFDSALTTDVIKNIEIKKGLAAITPVSKKGKIFRVAFVGSSDIDTPASKEIGIAVSVQKVLAEYVFIVTFGFNEPNEIIADEKKIAYDKMIRDVMDSNLTIGGLCIGITKIGEFLVAEHYKSKGNYFGSILLTCYRNETRGDR